MKACKQTLRSDTGLRMHWKNVVTNVDHGPIMIIWICCHTMNGATSKVHGSSPTGTWCQITLYITLQEYGTNFVNKNVDEVFNSLAMSWSQQAILVWRGSTLVALFPKETHTHGFGRKHTWMILRTPSSFHCLVNMERERETESN